MAVKPDIGARLKLRRGLSEAEAAMYLSLSPSFFRRLVDAKVMPRPRVVGTRRIWDVDELDAAFKALPREGGEDDVAFEGSESSWADFR